MYLICFSIVSILDETWDRYFTTYNTPKWNYLQEIRWTENTDKLDSRNRKFLIPKKEERHVFINIYKMYNMTSTSTVFNTEL